MVNPLRSIGVTWRKIDGILSGISAKLQTIVRALTAVRILAMLFALLLIAEAVMVAIFPEIFLKWTVVGLVVVSTVVPLLVIYFLVSIPFRYRSVIRLIRKGYPANSRELVLRMAARKMRDESIETEQLLLETAWNESRKMMDSYKRRAKKLKKQLDEMDD